MRPTYTFLPLPSNRAASDAIKWAAHERFADGGEDAVFEWPKGSGQFVWCRYDNAAAIDAGYPDYGQDGALDAFLSCGIAIPN